MKKLLFIALIMPIFSFAQVGVGTTDPNASLDVRSSNQATPVSTDGILIPKVDAFPATNPGIDQDGMLIYLTTADTFNSVNYTEGFHYWNWNAVTSTGRWVPITSIERINDLSDGKSDVDGSEDGSSVYLGINAGSNDDSSDNKNVGIGYLALQDIDGSTAEEGENNVAVGYHALRRNTVGRRNTALGNLTLAQNLSGNNNTALGGQALSSNTTGSSNISIGAFSLNTNVNGINNIATGNQSLRFNVDGRDNVAIGDYAGRSLDDVAGTNDDNNVYVGSKAGDSDVQGSNNVYIGYQAGAGDYNPEANTGTAETKSGNVFIGHQAGFMESANNRLYIENSNANQNNSLIWGRFDTDILRVNGTFQISNPNNNGYAFPTEDGTADQILVTDGNGALTFEDQQTIPVVPDVSTFTLVTATLATGTNQVLTTSGWQKVAFTNEILNATMATGLIDATNNRFIADADGFYRITASFHTTNAQETNNYFGIAVRLNGSATNYQEYSINHAYNGNPGNASQVARQISCVVELDASEYAEIFVFNDFAGTGSAVALDAASNKTQFTIERIR